jgi:predicted nucleotidyltransferase
MTTRAGLGIPEIIGDKREAILALAARYGASNVRIFGSVARGEADVESDVDILVTLAPHASLYDISGLWQDLSELLGREVSLVTEGALSLAGNEAFKTSVLSDAVAL